MLGVIGINHKSAPIAIREKFAFSIDQIQEFTSILLSSGFSGVVILSTCNRTEIYFDGAAMLNGSAATVLIEKLKSYKNLTQDIQKFFYIHTGKEAVLHVFNVVCGYDSLALGEYQIVGQVKEAYRIADEQKTLSKVLSRLFHKAFETSKKVRTTTEMNRGAASVSYAAVELANRTFCDLKSKRILLVGAGQTSELVVQNLKKRGCTDLRIVNRTFERAQNLAERYNGLAIDMALLQTAVAESDIVITSTGSQVALITETMVADIMAQRADLPLFFVDLSVPRNVDDRVAKIANVSVHDVDALQAVVAETFERRHSQLETGRAIINEFVVDFLSWLNTQKLQPTIKLLHDNFAEVQKAEIESFRKFNQNAASDDDLERFGERIAQQYVNHLIRNVRELTQNGQNEAYLGMLNQLFLLNKKA